MDDIVNHLPFLFTARSLFYGIIMWSVFLFSYRYGGWEEKAAISTIVIGSYLTFVLTVAFRVRYRNIELSVALEDLGQFLLLQFIALRSKKFWPLWLAALTGVPLITHLAPLMPGMLLQTYNNAIRLWSYPQLLVIALGTIHHHASRVREQGYESLGRHSRPGLRS